MSKYVAPNTAPTREQAEPKHSTGWTFGRKIADQFSMFNAPYTPGKHAKPFAKHHPATPVTYDHAGNVTPLRAVEHQLDVAA